MSERLPTGIKGSLCAYWISPRMGKQPVQLTFFEFNHQSDYFFPKENHSSVSKRKNTYKTTFFPFQPYSPLAEPTYHHLYWNMLKYKIVNIPNLYILKKMSFSLNVLLGYIGNRVSFFYMKAFEKFKLWVIINWQFHCKP